MTAATLQSMAESRRQASVARSMSPTIATAARLARMLERWSRLGQPQRNGALEALRRVAAKPSLSRDVREVVERALQNP